MKHITEFRNFEVAQALAHEIKSTLGERPLRVMEVCGGHTAAIHKYGIKNLLPSSLKLLSGPGCPVCVTHNRYIDTAIELSKQPEVVIATFGDLIRVPGSRSSLMKEKSQGRDVRICYSALDALEIAKREPTKKIIFLGIGFETTAPTVAAPLKRAFQEGVHNFYVLNAFKTMPHAMRALLTGGELALDAFICPGHVSVITGLSIYDFIARDFKTPCVVSGFEPLDLLQSILMICKQVKEGRAEVENQYLRAAQLKGNPTAQALLEDVFEASDVEWRGIGMIPKSGLKIRSKYAAHDAFLAFPMDIPTARENPGCICGNIMRGVAEPTQCKLFSKACTPEDPKGSCMVSDEGTCATYFKYMRQSL